MSDNDKYSLIANDNLQQTQHIQGFGTTYSQQAPPYYPNAPPHMNPTPNVPVLGQPQGLIVGPTTVITAQPTTRKWVTGCSDCCSNCSVCVGVYFCSLCYECAIAKKMEESGCLVFCPGGLSGLRTQYRMRHKIEGTMLDDACLSMCCRPCVLCQMANDMNAQGYPRTCCCI